MRNTEGHGELLARIDERTLLIHDSLKRHLEESKKRSSFVNKSLLFLLFLICIIGIDRLSTIFPVISKVFAGQ